MQEEKERVSQQASRQRTELDKLQRQLEDSHALALAAMKSEFEKAREEQENRHNVRYAVKPVLNTVNIYQVRFNEYTVSYTVNQILYVCNRYWEIQQI